MSVSCRMVYYEEEVRLSKTINNQRVLLLGYDLLESCTASKPNAQQGRFQRILGRGEQVK